MVVFRNERYTIARPKAFDREKALIQALQLFWRKGYHATSVEDLTEALHLSRSSLYDTFADKRTLFLEALKLYSQRVIARTARTLREAPSPAAGIQALFDEFAAGVGGASGALGCFMVNSVSELAPYDRDVTKIAAEYSAAMQRLLAEALARAAQPGAVAGPQTPEQLAAYVFNALQGVRILIKSGATREQVQAIGAITLNSLR
jgi:TetR/AcrR family transcriptional regulator, transcriptional repressor for nem operon